MSLNWRNLNKVLTQLSEGDLLRLLNEERQGAKRVTILTRLHQRYCVVRADRERIELLKEAVK